MKSRLKDNITPRDYEMVLANYARTLDTWFLSNRDRLNKEHARLTYLGILDAYETTSPTSVLDLDKTTVYFGRWENVNTFKGQAVVGLEYGMLWLIDSLLDLWFKFVRESQFDSTFHYDKTVEGLFQLRADLVSLMGRHTTLILGDVTHYHLPASDRPKPSQLYYLEFYDLGECDGGVVLEKITASAESLDNYGKFNVARKLAESLGSKHTTKYSILWYPTTQAYKEMVFNRHRIRDSKKLPAPAGASDKYLKAEVQKKDEWFSFHAPTTATEYMIAEEARQQQALYDEMRKRVATLETAWREAGGKTTDMNILLQNAVEAHFNYHDAMNAKPCTPDEANKMFEETDKKLKHLQATRAVGAVPAPPSLDEEIERLKKVLILAKLNAEISEWNAKRSASQRIITYPGDEGKTKYTVKIHDALLSELGGPAKRDLVIDSPQELLLMNVYQDGALKTFNKNMSWENQVHNAVYGLSEAGEVVNTLKKFFFHPWDKELYQKFAAMRQKAGLELGDLLYYLAVLASLLNYPLGEIGKMNRQKLVDRHGNVLESPNANKQEV